MTTLTAIAMSTPNAPHLLSNFPATVTRTATATPRAPKAEGRAVSLAATARPTFFIGNRMDNVGRMPLVRRIVNRRMSDQIKRVCGQKIPDTQCGYRMLHRGIIPDMLGGGH